MFVQYIFSIKTIDCFYTGAMTRRLSQLRGASAVCTPKQKGKL